MKRTLIAMVIVGLGLAFLPICPIQFQIRTEQLKSGTIIYPVYERKLPFSEWKAVFYNPFSEDEAKNWIKFQPHFDSLVAFDFYGGKFLPLGALPVPRAFDNRPTPRVSLKKNGFSIPACEGIADPEQKLNCELAEIHFTMGMVYHFEGNTTDAIREYRKALEYNPNHDTAKKTLQNLGENLQ